MEIVVSTHEHVTIVEPRGRIDSTTSRELGRWLQDLIQEGRQRLIIDFGRVAYISSAGFRVLLIAAKDAKDRSRGFALCNLSQEVRRLFEIGAFLDLFPIYPTREEGVAASA
ncbi:MAG TPA: STAS domain-containing protein [Stellaceae bacterium]|nr:STAS domain-containing protein [Stellaceae bacterium]